jgi:glutathione S-transferase
LTEAPGRGTVERLFHPPEIAMRLYYSASSPYVRKVMVVAHELGLTDKIEKHTVSAHPINRSAELSAANPLGKVPALQLDDGAMLYDSPVIAEYLASLSPQGQKIFPASGAARWRALTLQALGDGLLDAMILIRYEQVARPKEFQWSGWLEGQQAKIDTGLKEVEAHPLDDDLGIGAISVGCALGYLDLRFGEFDWRKAYPNTARWFTGFAARPSMRATESPDLKKK